MNAPVTPLPPGWGKMFGELHSEGVVYEELNYSRTECDDSAARDRDDEDAGGTEDPEVLRRLFQHMQGF